MDRRRSGLEQGLVVDVFAGLESLHLACVLQRLVLKLIQATLEGRGVKGLIVSSTITGWRFGVSSCLAWAG